MKNKTQLALTAQALAHALTMIRDAEQRTHSLSPSKEHERLMVDIEAQYIKTEKLLNRVKIMRDKSEDMWEDERHPGVIKRHNKTRYEYLCSKCDKWCHEAYGVILGGPDKFYFLCPDCAP